MKFSDGFFQAVCDYRYLLEHNYPQKSMLKMVGDRYMLRSYERVMLYRALTTKQQIKTRYHKMAHNLPVLSMVTLDGFNVCRTVGSYLNGNLVFVGMDGYLRDVSELHRKKLKWEVLEKAVDMILDFLKEKGVVYARFYFDSPISHSGKMCEMTRQKMAEKNLTGEAQTVFSPDYALITAEHGILCTADSNIIEHSRLQVFDLAYHLLKEKFQAKIFSFPEYLSDKECEKFF